MNAIRVDAGRGWGWITEGWRLFASAPGVWIVILLIYLGINVVLSLIPLIGGLAYLLLSPVLTGGILYGADKQARGETLEIGDLFRGFQDQGRMGPLVILGLISLAGYLLMGLILVVFIGGGIATGIVLDDPGQGITPEMIEGLFGVGFMVLILVELTLWAVIMMAMLYAIPLVSARQYRRLLDQYVAFAGVWPDRFSPGHDCDDSFRPWLSHSMAGDDLRSVRQLSGGVYGADAHPGHAEKVAMARF